MISLCMWSYAVELAVLASLSDLFFLGSSGTVGKLQASLKY
jgi:hypothetical protein